MLFFRKNKRQFGFRSHRKLFVAIFLFLVFGISGVVSLILNAMAAEAPVPFIEIFSEHSNFTNNEPGSWKIKKSAEWTGLGKAKIVFETESIMRYGDKKRDIVLVVDNSASMSGDKITQAKTDAIELVDALLSDADNRVALITFNSDAEILSELSNDKNNIINIINNIPTPGNTNYYQGLLKAEEVLEGYDYDGERELILLFLTDGYPNTETPNEVAQYHVLKAKYPYMTINGVQYEMGNTVLQPIIDVSDNQFIANMNSLNNVLFDAAITPYLYDDFVVKDYIDDRYWTVSGIEALEASIGDVNLEYDGETPIVVWDLSGQYRSGNAATLTIEIDLKPELIAEERRLFPTNLYETVESSIEGILDENVSSSDTPILKNTYNVIYDSNAPSDCVPFGVVPETSEHGIYTVVAIIDNQLTCENYNFMGWSIAYSGHITYINNDYFIMPPGDVYIEAIWARPTISKSMDGTIHETATATLDIGESINVKMKKLSGQTNVTTATINDAITSIKRADELPLSVNTDSTANIISAATSKLPIYAWYDNGIIYYYTEAEEIFLNESAGSLFYGFSGLMDIDSISEWNASKMISADRMFYGAVNLVSLDALANWDISHTMDMSYMFSGTTNLADISGLANWNTSNLTNVSYMFNKSSTIVNLDSLSNWDMSKAENMSCLFYNATSLADISGLANWDTSNVKNMSYMFAFTDIQDVDALTTKTVNGVERWSVANVTNMKYMFGDDKKLSDIDGIANWDTSSATDISYMFRRAIISNADALETKIVDGIKRWDVSNVAGMAGIFESANNLVDIEALASWDTSSATSLSSTFSRTNISDIDDLAGWDTSNVTSMSYMFDGITSLNNIDGATNWITTKVAYIQGMFRDTSITNIDALATKTVNGIERWNLSSVVTMWSMFYGAKNLTNIDGAIGWDTSNVTEMSSMFDSARSLTNLNGASNWNTSKVKKMMSMFYNTEKLSDASGVANWDTSSLVDVSGMFREAGEYASSFILDISHWNMSKVTAIVTMLLRAGYGGGTNWEIIIPATNGAGINNTDTVLYGASESVKIDLSTDVGYTGRHFTLAAP